MRFDFINPNKGFDCKKKRKIDEIGHVQLRWEKRNKKNQITKQFIEIIMEDGLFRTVWFAKRKESKGKRIEKEKVDHKSGMKEVEQLILGHFVEQRIEIVASECVTGAS